MKKQQIRWISKFLAGIMFTLTFVYGSTYIIDPYQYFRKAKLYKPVYLNDVSRYMNAGLIKNYDYDSAIVGNSMTENFLTENLRNNLGWNTIKLAMQGATSYEDNLVFDALFRQNKVKNILTTFDVFAYNQEPTATLGDMPQFLYNENKLDDFKYIVNFSRLKRDLKNIYIHNYKVKESRFTDIKMAYFWGDTAEYSKNNVFNNILESFNLKDTKDLKLPAVNLFDENYVNNILNNFNNHLYKYILEHPEVNFKIVLPPYSIVYWKQQQFTGSIDEVQYSMNYVIEKLLPMKNVELYDFQSEKLFTHNLDTYRDMVHHSHDASLFIIAKLNSQEYLLTENNWRDYRQALQKQMDEYVFPPYTK